MSPTDYVRAVTEYLDGQGWERSMAEVQSGVYVVIGKRGSGSGAERLIVMIVTEPVEAVSADHVEYLLSKAESRGIDSVGLATDRDLADDVRAEVEDLGITILADGQLRTGEE